MLVQQLLQAANQKKLVSDYAFELAYLLRRFEEADLQEFSLEGDRVLQKILDAKAEPPKRMLQLMFSPYTNVLAWRIEIPDEALEDPAKLACYETVFPETYREIIGSGTPQMPNNEPPHEIQYPALIILLSIWEYRRMRDLEK